MHQRLIISLAAIFTLLPLTAYADAPPLAESGQSLSSYKAVEPLKEPDVAPVQELVPEPVQSAPVQPVTASGVVAGCGDNQYAQFIYAHESGCRLDARNSGGCLGIGQACPGSKLLNVCPDLNYDCQNQFFTQYANSAYGGWEQAYNAWVSKGWW